MSLFRLSKAEFDEALARAESGSEEWQIVVGSEYASGRSVSADMEKAVFWMRRAVQSSNPIFKFKSASFLHDHGCQSGYDALNYLSQRSFAPAKYALAIRAIKKEAESVSAWKMMSEAAAAGHIPAKMAIEMGKAKHGSIWSKTKSCVRYLHLSLLGIISAGKNQDNEDILF